MNRVKVGEIISKFRKEKNISQEVLAEVLGIPRPSISQIEKGGRDLSFSEFNKILEIFQISYDEFMAYLNEVKVKGTSKVRNNKIKLNPSKFKQLFLYILEKCGSKHNVGETVLYKLCYFCDFDYFELYEKPLTGMIYKRLQYGPVPSQELYNPIINEMIEEGILLRVNRPYKGDTIQTKYISFIKPDLSEFNNNEREVMDKVIERLSNMGARQIEAHSHRDYPWISHTDGEEIEYFSVFQRTGEFAQRDYDKEFLNASVKDSFGSLEPLTKNEYEYYISLNNNE